MNSPDEICEKVKAEYDCLCCFNIVEMLSGKRVVFSILAKQSEREHLYWRLLQCGAEIAYRKDTGDFFIGDMESFTKAVEMM